MAWRVKHRRASWFRPIEGERKWCFRQQYSGGPTSQDYPSSYSSQHLLPKPSYLPSPAFALPSAYLPPAPGYAYPQQCGLSAGYTHSTPSLLPSGLHTPTPLHSSHAAADLPRNKKFGFDQSKTARVSPYTIRDKTERQKQRQWWECQRKLWNRPPELQAR